MDSVVRFVADLARATIGSTVNPYACHDPELDRPGGAAIRLENLRQHLTGRHRPALLLVGEAPSYRGCRFSGIAFTSERALRPAARSSTHPRGWTEPSATIVHRVLRQLEIEDRTMLWNAVPTHPAGARPLSNRTPTTLELDAGVEWLKRLLALVEPALVVAVGRSAASVLADAPSVRHPANGGARLFAEQLAAILTGVPDATVHTRGSAKVPDLPTRLGRLAAHLAAFETPVFEFGRWVEATTRDDGVIELGWYSTSPAADAFVQDAYELGWVIDFDWPRWMSTPEGQSFLADPARVRSATVESLAKLVTVFIRQDRFADGALAEAFKAGFLTAILRRARELADACEDL